MEREREWKGGDRERERERKRESKRGGGRKEIEEMNVELGVSIILLTGAKNSLP